MVRPKKSVVASRANGGRAANKGLAVNVKEELFGFYSSSGSYVIKKSHVRRDMAKGEVRVRESGCELNVFTFCLYHSKLLRSAEDNKQNKNARRYGKDGVIIERWTEAEERAALMVEKCAHLDTCEKLALLRKHTKSAKVQIEFER